MKTTCNTIQEFLEIIDTEIKSHGQKCVFQGIIRISISERPLSDDPTMKREDILRWMISIRATTIIDLGADVGQYLLEMGVECGRDCRDSNPEPDMSGTEEANRQKAIVKSFADYNSLTVGPGVIEF